MGSYMDIHVLLFHIDDLRFLLQFSAILVGPDGGQ